MKESAILPALLAAVPAYEAILPALFAIEPIEVTASADFPIPIIFIIDDAESAAPDAIDAILPTYSAA